MEKKENVDVSLERASYAIALRTINRRYLISLDCSQSPHRDAYMWGSREAQRLGTETEIWGQSGVVLTDWIIQFESEVWCSGLSRPPSF
jgi:hypothetical protein